MKKFTLKTGEDLRWFVQPRFQYANAEKEVAKIFELYPSPTQSGEIRLEELETPFARGRRMTSKSIARSRRPSQIQRRASYDALNLLPGTP